MARKGCTPWNKGLDQRTGLPPNEAERSVWSAVRRTIREAIRCGILDRPKVCSTCAQERFTHAHAADPKRPLDVEWYCKDCQPKAYPVGLLAPKRRGRR